MSQHVTYGYMCSEHYLEKKSFWLYQVKIPFGIEFESTSRTNICLWRGAVFIKSFWRVGILVMINPQSGSGVILLELFSHFFLCFYSQGQSNCKFSINKTLSGCGQTSFLFIFLHIPQVILLFLIFYKNVFSSY